MDLISHVNGDDDLLDAWFRHYRRLGVTRFHLIIHGPDSQNRRLLSLLDDHPITVIDRYEGEFIDTEKLRRLRAAIDDLRGRWMLLVDSDEFLELPEPDLAATVHRLESLHTDVLAAPMVQRITADGSLDTPSVVDEPFTTFPRCSVDLYALMGVTASIDKHPLFRCEPTTVLNDAGTHGLPYGSRGRPAPLRGVTHHFKWRSNVRDRITARANSSHPFRHESAGFGAYLASHEWRVPLEGSFIGTTEELRRRRLLGAPSPVAYGVRRALSLLPTALDDGVMDARRRLAAAVSRTR